MDITIIGTEPGVQVMHFQDRVGLNKPLGGHGDPLALGGQLLGVTALATRLAPEHRDHHLFPYGSAESRRPSPTKLNATTATTTAMPGSSSHGAFATTLTLCASCSSAPRDTAGACRPRPKKDSAVSDKIIVGTARDTVAMMWEAKEGSMCREMIRLVGTPSNRAANT